MQYTIKSNKVIEVNRKVIVFDFPIETILDFEDTLIIYLMPKDNSEYVEYIERIEKKNTPNLIAINDEGNILWKISNRFIDRLKRVHHKSSLLILDYNLREQVNSRHELLITIGCWNFYINPKTGEKIREEQWEK
jgi:hypothetical protein